MITDEYRVFTEIIELLGAKQQLCSSNTNEKHNRRH